MEFVQNLQVKLLIQLSFVAIIIIIVLLLYTSHAHTQLVLSKVKCFRSVALPVLLPVKIPILSAPGNVYVDVRVQEELFLIQLRRDAFLQPAAQNVRYYTKLNIHALIKIIFIIHNRNQDGCMA